MYKIGDSIGSGSGKEIKVSPKANASFHPPGYRTEFFVDTVSVVIGIGNNHVADLVMSEAAWNDLQKGEKVNIVTTEDFKKKYVYKKKLLNTINWQGNSLLKIPRT